jgi:deoxyribonuclease-4
LGAHVSIAGGLPCAFAIAAELRCETIQLFVKNASQWQGRELTAPEVESFLAARSSSTVVSVFAHASYLINIAASEETTLQRSLVALLDEHERCRRLGLDGLVLHPGAHRGDGLKRGLARAADSLLRVLERTRGAAPPILLENTAGQGTSLGGDLDTVGVILQEVGAGSALGLCIDTCHAFAAGYDLRRASGLEALVGAQSQLGGAGCWHLNDSLGGPGSHRDRHLNIGAGALGARAFGKLVRHESLRNVPMILETPRGPTGDGHARDLRKLRRMRAAQPPGRTFLASK